MLVHLVHSRKDGVDRPLAEPVGCAQREVGVDLDGIPGKGCKNRPVGGEDEWRDIVLHIINLERITWPRLVTERKLPFRAVPLLYSSDTLLPMMAVKGVEYLSSGVEGTVRLKIEKQGIRFAPAHQPVTGYIQLRFKAAVICGLHHVPTLFPRGRATISHP